MMTTLYQYLQRVSRHGLTKSQIQYEAALSRLSNGTSRVGKIAFNAVPVRGSWGGGNQWLAQLSRYLRYLGFSVVYDLSQPDIDCILILHSSKRQGWTFGPEEIRAYQSRFPSALCVHRVNENDARKGTSFMNADIQKMNEVADFTVFLSNWLRDYHISRWFDANRPHSTIINGADSRYFHPIGSVQWASGQMPLILVTHHWSDHWNKGFRIYKQVDEMIADGHLSDTELWVIGRWPSEIRWRAARTFPPCSGAPLADRLRKAHVYITASLAEPGGMHFIEGIQCGLPLIFHADGGGIVEVGRRVGGIEFTDDPLGAIRRMQQTYASVRRELLDLVPTGEKMSAAYASLIVRLLCDRSYN